MYLFISALFSFSFTNTNIHLKFLITIIFCLESSRGFLMWAVQSLGRRLRPLVWVRLHHIEYDYTSGLHCGAMRTAHIKNPDGFAEEERVGCLQRRPTPYGRGMGGGYYHVQASPLRSDTCLQKKKNPLRGFNMKI